MRPPRWLLQCVLAVTAVVLSRCSTAARNPQHPLALSHNLDEAYSDLKRLLTLHKKLVEIESITGNEHDVGVYLHSYLAGHNLTVERQYVVGPATEGASHRKTKPRFNVLAYPGHVQKARVLLSSHIDVVPPFWPYERRNNDEIWGRGSVDAKACVATMITAVEELRAAGEIKAGDVAMLFVVGEERGGDGMRAANQLNPGWETVIFGEPTELKLASGHKGLLWFDVKAEGKAAHSGYPWLGESANAMLIPALDALLKSALPSSEKYGNSTLNIGLMNGGVAANVMPQTAAASISIRIAEGNVQKTKELVLDTVRKVDDRLDIIFNPGSYSPIYIDSDVKGRRFLHNPPLLCSQAQVSLLPLVCSAVALQSYCFVSFYQLLFLEACDHFLRSCSNTDLRAQ